MVRLCFAIPQLSFLLLGAVNDKPLAVDDAKSTQEDSPIVVDVQTNDSDLDGDALTTEILDSN